MDKAKKNRKYKQNVQKEDADQSSAKPQKTGEIPKKAMAKVPEKPKEVKEPSFNPELQFANLKRETQDILNISECKFVKRQVHSNWEKYEMPLEETEVIGANFEDLLLAPISVGGHFKFKSEKVWDVDLDGQFREYFNLDLKMLGDGLSALAFYDLLDLDKAIFCKEELKKMNSQAEKRSIYYHQLLKSREKTVQLEDNIGVTESSNKILGILMDKETECEDSKLTDNSTIANSVCTQEDAVENTVEPIFITPANNTPTVTHTLSNTANSEEKPNYVASSTANRAAVNTVEDEDLDELLNLTAPVEDNFTVTKCDDVDIIHEDNFKIQETPCIEPDVKVTLEDWLDDLLN